MKRSSVDHKARGGELGGAGPEHVVPLAARRSSTARVERAASWTARDRHGVRGRAPASRGGTGSASRASLVVDNSTIIHHLGSTVALLSVAESDCPAR
ncbi:hypothetical protein [Streptomyces sp. NK15101]|uniref:hypothetical protein n=1 Tax=Streptomyces sp. NK15101 TaxID=2873261 RepID=UPI001CEDD7AC|nr:hypothetical protein [Streptomyces sp. NK15101]